MNRSDDFLQSAGTSGGILPQETPWGRFLAPLGYRGVPVENVGRAVIYDQVGVHVRHAIDQVAELGKRTMVGRSPEGPWSPLFRTNGRGANSFEILAGPSGPPNFTVSGMDRDALRANAGELAAMLGSRNQASLGRRIVLTPAEPVPAWDRWDRLVIPVEAALPDLDIPPIRFPVGFVPAVGDIAAESVNSTRTLLPYEIPELEPGPLPRLMSTHQQIADAGVRLIGKAASAPENPEKWVGPLNRLVFLVARNKIDAERVRTGMQDRQQQLGLPMPTPEQRAVAFRAIGSAATSQALVRFNPEASRLPKGSYLSGTVEGFLGPVLDGRSGIWSPTQMKWGEPLQNPTARPQVVLRSHVSKSSAAADSGLLKSHVVVLFDMDGTLVQTTSPGAGWAEANEKVAQTNKFSLSDADRDQINRNGWSTEDVAKFMAGKSKSLDPKELTEGIVTAMVTVIEESDQVVAMPGAVEMMNTLDRMGIEYGLVTASDRRIVDAALDKAGIDVNRFRHVVTANSVDDTKPAGHPYNRAVELFEHDAREAGLPPVQAIAVEDSGTGIKSAKAAGLPMIYAENGHLTRGKKEHDRNIFRVASLKQLNEKVLKRLLNPKGWGELQDQALQRIQNHALKAKPSTAVKPFGPAAMVARLRNTSTGVRNSPEAQAADPAKPAQSSKLPARQRPLRMPLAGRPAARRSTASPSRLPPASSSLPPRRDSPLSKRHEL